MTKEEQFLVWLNNQPMEVKAAVLGIEDYDPLDENSEMDIVITKIVDERGPVLQQPEPFYPDNDYPLIQEGR